MNKNLGPQMLAAAYYVSNHPGCAILPVAKNIHIGAEQGTNNALGYDPVHRAMRAGLIYDSPAGVTYRASKRGLYALFTPEQVAGARAASAIEALARALG